MEKREKIRESKEKRLAKKRRRITVAVCIAVGLAAVCLLLFGLKVIPLESIAAPEPTLTPTPEPTPEPTPTPELTVYIPAPEVNVYTARLSVFDGKIEGSMRLHYVNNAEDTLYAIMLHLDPEITQANALSIDRLTLNGRGAYYTINENILKVPLAVEVLPGEDCVIYMDMTVDLNLFENDGSLSNLLPAAAVYEHGWLTEVTPEDAAYTAPATYSVIVSGGLSCELPYTEPGHYYAENRQGITFKLN